MANLIKLRKGLDINLKGKATTELIKVKEPGFYAICPDDFTGVTPKVVVKEQEYVMAGGPLFIDKNHPELKFVSPVSGVVTSVERGARRKVMSITVEAAAEQDYEEFGKQDVAKLDGSAVKELLLNAGLFAFIRQRPYDVIADPTIAPRAIFVSAFDTNPLAPDFEFALKGEEANFQTGVDMQCKFFYLQLIDQIVDFTFQCIRKQDRRLDFSFSETGRAIFVCRDIHSRTYPLACDLHQSEFAKGQNIMFRTVFLHILAHTFIELLPVLGKVHVDEVDNDDASHIP